MDNNSKQNIKADMTQRIQKQLKNNGMIVDLTGFNIDFDAESKAQFPGLSDMEILSQLEDSELDRLASNVAQDIVMQYVETITKNSDEYDNFIETNYIEQFKNNPTEKNLLALKNITCSTWRSKFAHAKKHPEEIKNNPPYTFTDAELKEILNCIDVCYNVDLYLLKANKAIDTILDSHILEITNVFSENLKNFENDIAKHENIFKYLQVNSANINEFELKMQASLNDYKEKKGNLTLTDVDKLLFRDKKELEQLYAEIHSAHKKAIEMLKKTQSAKNTLEQLKEKGKTSYMHEFYERLIPFHRTDIIDTNVEIHSKGLDLFLRKKQEFQDLCTRQLMAKQHLKDLTRKIESYIKVSHEQNNDRQA